MLLDSPVFPYSMIDRSPKLKRQQSKGYYAQVQGQLSLRGLDWCDFVVFLLGSHTISVEKVLFDLQYWNHKLLPKLHSLYFTHAVPYLKKKVLLSEREYSKKKYE